jgi:AraC family transcriptional regulator of adaptative response/methylated-DNA-[protein]-cysteine methyltransferase
MSRDASADGAFVYSVKTTGVYCRPVCPARRPRRKNVAFHASCSEAERAGFRACRRCRPSEQRPSDRTAQVVSQACRTLEESDRTPSLDSLAQQAGLSRHHFHRLFKAHTGVTPRAYAEAVREQRLRSMLLGKETITSALHAAGYASSSRFYEASMQRLGMTPRAYRNGGEGETLRFAVGECWLGSVLVAMSERGVCAILLGDDPDGLAKELQDRFSRATLIGCDEEFERVVSQVVAFVEHPDAGLKLPLDIRGTAFQRRVWEALQKIPSGSTVTYRELAAAIGSPASARAIGQACAANRLAVAIPCHRVVRTDKSLSGYRWGVERKARLLARESQLEGNG